MPFNRPAPLTLASAKRGTPPKRAADRRGSAVPAAAAQRVPAESNQATAASIQALQARYGNRAVQRLIQTKLLVGPASDPYEQEADRVAQRVMRGGTQNVAGTARRVQRADAGAGFEAGPEIEARLSALHGQGSPLPQGLRQHMESGLQANFQSVRVHTDPESHRLNRSLQAQAFTHGSDIYMGEGKFNPASSQGQHLLAHELAHVVQQTGAGAQRQPEAENGAAQPIQRFPANVLTSPINWDAQDYAIRQSASGAMGGVSFFRSTHVAEGEVASVVVKSLVAGEGEQVVLGEKALATLGENVPNSRQVHSGDPEFAQLARALDLVIDEQGVAHTVNHRAIHSFMIMPSLPAHSLGDLAVDAKTDADIDRLVDVLVDADLLRTVGRLAVFDSAIGNFDRITAEGLNFGNIMVSDPEAHAALQFWAIDTAANLPKLEANILDRVTASGGFDENTRSNPGLLKKLMDHGPADLAERFIDGLAHHMLNTQSAKIMAAGEAEQEEIMADSPRVRQLAAHLSASLAAHRPHMVARITEGFHIGTQRLINLMSGMNKGGQDRQEIKAAAQLRGSWETLKAHTRYLELRARGGLDHTAAADYVKRYAAYRVLKNTGVPTPSAVNPVQFSELEFPDILLKSRPLLATQSTKQTYKQNQAQQAGRFQSDLRVFMAELDKQNHDLHRLLGPAQFSLTLMRDEVRREAAERREPGQRRGAVAPANAVDLKRQALLMQKINDLYRVSLSVLAYAEVYKLKGNAFLPGLLKLRDGSLREYGPGLRIQVETLFQEMEALKTLHRRLEVHAG